MIDAEAYNLIALFTNEDICELTCYLHSESNLFDLFMNHCVKLMKLLAAFVAQETCAITETNILKVSKYSVMRLIVLSVWGNFK